MKLKRQIGGEMLTPRELTRLRKFLWWAESKTISESILKEIKELSEIIDREIANESK